MKDGVINVNKPEGMTSNDVIYCMKRILGIKKIGHTGTLDPLATGVLPILINRATRIAEYMDMDFKTYRATMLLGKITDTLDITGEVIEERSTENVTRDAVISAFSGFEGLISQMPPLYSAVRINGRKLYEVMHEGQTDEIEAVKKKIKPRQVYIKSLEVQNIDLEKMRVSFTVCCSKGTYIRTICGDVGERLGCGATMEKLERTESGMFKVEDAVSIDELKDVAKKAGILDENGYSVDKSFHEDIPEIFEKYVIPLDKPLINFGIVRVNEDFAKRVLDGWHLGYNECEVIKRPFYEEVVSKDELFDANPKSPSNHSGSYPGLKVHPEYAKAYRVYRDDGKFVAVSIHSDRYHKLVADKVFLRNEDL